MSALVNESNLSKTPKLFDLPEEDRKELLKKLDNVAASLKEVFSEASLADGTTHNKVRGGARDSGDMQKMFNYQNPDPFSKLRKPFLMPGQLNKNITSELELGEINHLLDASSETIKRIKDAYPRIKFKPYSPFEENYDSPEENYDSPELPVAIDPSVGMYGLASGFALPLEALINTIWTPKPPMQVADYTDITNEKISEARSLLHEAFHNAGHDVKSHQTTTLNSYDPSETSLLNKFGAFVLSAGMLFGAKGVLHSDVGENIDPFELLQNNSTEVTQQIEMREPLDMRYVQAERSEMTEGVLTSTESPVEFKKRFYTDDVKENPSETIQMSQLSPEQLEGISMALRTSHTDLEKFQELPPKELDELYEGIADSIYLAVIAPSKHIKNSDIYSPDMEAQIADSNLFFNIQPDNSSVHFADGELIKITPNEYDKIEDNIKFGAQTTMSVSVNLDRLQDIYTPMLQNGELNYEHFHHVRAEIYNTFAEVSRDAKATLDSGQNQIGMEYTAEFPLLTQGNVPIQSASQLPTGPGM